MKILFVYRGILLGNSGITDLVGDRVFIDRVDQNSETPNILLEMPEEGQDYTHSGPSGLFEGHLKVIVRAAGRNERSNLGKLVRELLETWKGTESDLEVQLTEHFNTRSGFEEKAEVFTNTTEYTSFYREVSP